ncbi:CDP-diacylglycerol--glycerol-3-phosphate 3-phosphatidyltransferase [Spiroplasma culicicola]|uniref:CDP-diacylglycerol--glycerol-3-phosphate 3-phosphatidyltransferase n=1 Tax=Spiroplasma culicicola AES-1 TaxID=1276246 RepID=W6A8E8_9MOLU|nr:CDP-diacylglycerol--glycerol-3-phosphate 3-phosphatidyltransferase [Spiroplasma culicicola]AHI53226.1 CDP-diacylglycerol-glycerol-3-phosphate 3-phosphatidyltransferase [Spiroplasma culicicola AES-1]
MNWANRITMIRIILIPVIVTLMLLYNFNGAAPFFNVFTAAIEVGNYHLPYTYLIAGILFIIASLTDMLDGYIARKYNQVTTFGKFFDSIADKLLTNGVLVIFAAAGIVPVWMAVVLICRDFLIDVVRQILATATVVMAANQLGRFRAAFEMLGLTILFFVGFRMFDGGLFGGTGTYDEYGWINQVIMIPMYIATVLSILAAINYIWLNRKVLFDMTNKKKEANNG